MNTSTAPSNYILQEGFCERDCGYYEWIFLFLLFLSVVASFASGIPSQQAHIFISLLS